ncbi:MAG TPA: hypothetical protein VIO94_12200 [Phenylobacterium sp.]
MTERRPSLRIKIACAAVWLALGAAGAAHAEIARDIESRTEALRASSGPSRAEEIAGLEQAIARGERASGELRGQIAGLEAQTRKLQEEKAALERIQVVLTSGLIGAIVTALVAILGAFAKVRSGREERELQRLQVIEKAFELRAKGVPLPADLQAVLGGRPVSSAGQ